MKPVWSLSFWSLLESRISKIKVIGFMGQSCHSESSGHLINHATFMDHESDISCNEKLYSYNLARGKEITVPWGHHHTATMHQLQEQEEQQQGKAIQLRRVSATTPRRLASARTEVRLTDAGSNGERVWSLLPPATVPPNGQRPITTTERNQDMNCCSTRTQMVSNLCKVSEEA